MWLAPALILSWIAASSTIILYNKFLIFDMGFDFPGTLAIFHQFASLLLALVAVYMCRIEVPVLRLEIVGKNFVIMAILFSVNLWCSNMAYMYLSVAFIQMIKAITPCIVLMFSFILRIETPSLYLVAIIVVITCGVLMTSINDQSRSAGAFGLVIQMVAIVAEALRLTLTKKLFKDISLSPIAALLYMCPSCLVILCTMWLASEGPRLCSLNMQPIHAIPPLYLCTNAACAFLLNASSMLLVKYTSALTLNISGIVNDFLLIAWSVAVAGATVGWLQYIGYAVSTVGICLYTHFKHTQPAASPSPDDDETMAKLLDDDADLDYDADDDPPRD